MQYPIKYIENNLVWNHDGECFAYYELIPYNYSFLSVEQKEAVHDAFRQLIAQNRDGKIHALQISTESSIRAAQERSKAYASGNLREAALRRIDGQTEALVSMIGENQVDYRFQAAAERAGQREYRPSGGKYLFRFPAGCEPYPDG